jgi:SAM-dependent methyltransferase
MPVTNIGLQQIWRAADLLLHSRLSVGEARDAFANLLFYRWVDEEAERNPAFRDAIFAMQAKRYRWSAALEEHPQDFGTFLYEDVYPFLGALDRAAPDIAFFFRFVDSGHPLPELHELAAAIDKIDVHKLRPEDAGTLVDGLVPLDGRGPPARTLESIRQLFAEVLQVRPNERVLDLACGTAGFLHDIALRLTEEGSALGPSLGIDIQPTALKFARLRFLLGGMPVPELRLGDALIPEQLPDDELGRFNVVVCDPPLGRAKHRSAQSRAFDTDAAQNELLFLQLAMDAMAPGGRAAIVLPPAFFFASGAAQEVRETLFKKYAPEAVFALPRGSIPGTAIEPLAVFFSSAEFSPRKPARLFFFENKESESVAEYVARAVNAWRQSKSGTAHTGRWINDEELRGVNYNVLRLKDAVVAQPERAPPSLDAAVQEAHQSWKVIQEHLEGLLALGRTSAQSVCLKDLIHRVRAERFDSSQTWLLTLDQIEPHTGRILQKRRGDSSKGQTGGMVPFEAGDILYSRLNPHLGKAIVADESGYCVSDLIPFRVDPGRILPTFVAWMMRGPGFEDRARRAAVGTGRLRISVDELLKFAIPVPSMATQVKIVAALDTAAAAVLEARLLGAIVNNLRGSVFDQLFGDDIFKRGDK